MNKELKKWIQKEQKDFGKVMEEVREGMGISWFITLIGCGIITLILLGIIWLVKS